jgi:hypothetical protein
MMNDILDGLRSTSAALKFKLSASETFKSAVLGSEGEVGIHTGLSKARVKSSGSGQFLCCGVHSSRHIPYSLLLFFL